MTRPRSRGKATLAASAAMLATLALAACNTGEAVDVSDAGGDTSAEDTSTSADTTDGGDAAPAEEAPAGTLVAAIAGEPDMLDPNSTTSYFSFQVLENVYDTLVEPDPELVMQPALAESWETSEDQLTWTFHLREGVTWHDGSEFTADDVVYTYTRIMDGDLAASWRFSAVESVTAVDDMTVEIQVTSPSPNLLANIGGYKGVAIVQQENVESGDITTSPVGTGPFVFESYQSGSAINLTSNADYWGGAPAIDGVQFQFITEPTTAMAALDSGQIHWTDNVPPQQVDGLAGRDDIVLGQVGSNDYWYLALNQAHAPLDQVEVRQAIAYAIDREAITEATMFGNATVNQTAIPEASAWASDYAPYSYDPDKARELLETAGVDPSTIPMDIMVATDYPETVTAAQIVVAQLADVGINATITQLDFGTWLAEQGEGNFDMLMMGWLGNIDPDDFYYSQHHTEGGNNYQGYSDPEVDAMLDEARTETDEDARKELYDQIAERIVDGVSYIYLYNPDVIQVWSSDVDGYEALGGRAIRFRDVTLTE